MEPARIIFDYYGFSFHLEYVREIEVINSGTGLILSVQKGLVKKRFSVPKRKVKGYYLGNEVQI